MRIVFVIANYFPVLGGQEMYAQGIAERLAAKGHEMHVVTGVQPNAKGFERIGGVSVRRLKGLRFGFSKMKYWPALGTEIKRIKPDLIQCFGHDHLYTLLCTGAAKRQGVPLAVLTYGPLVAQCPRNPVENMLARAYDAAITPYIFGNASYVLHRTPSMSEWCGEKGASRSALALTGIDRAFFGKTKKNKCNKFTGQFRGKKVVGFVGTLCRRKGIAELIEAVPAVLEKHEDALFVVVGSANPETEGRFSLGVKKRARELGIENSVKFLQPIGQDSAAGLEKFVDLFDSFDVFCLPSAFEAPSQVMLQAMARGRPVVVADIPSLRGIVDKRNGFLVKYGDVSALGSAICSLLGNKGLRERHGERNKEDAKRYLLDAVAAEMEKLYLGMG